MTTHRVPDPASRTQRAVAMVDAGVTAYVAARHLGIHQSCITRALAARERRRAAQGDLLACPACGKAL